MSASAITERRTSETPVVSPKIIFRMPSSH
jgi:hypothetical protein